jgi:Ala-tRNA(Pro) deacylase
MPDLFTLLHDWGIPFEKYDHPAVFTCEESDRLCPPMPGAHTKQLLMRDKKKRHYVLAIVMHDKQVDTKVLGELLGTGRLSFASPPDLQRILNVEPGAVTPFGLLFDKHHTVEHVVVDEDAWAIGSFRFHPLRNDATLVIDRRGFETFLRYTQHPFQVMSIPQSPLDS